MAEHAFADALFRVYRREHPQLEFDSVGMAAPVAAMMFGAA